MSVAPGATGGKPVQHLWDEAKICAVVRDPAKAGQCWECRDPHSWTLPSSCSPIGGGSVDLCAECHE